MDKVGTHPNKHCKFMNFNHKTTKVFIDLYSPLKFHIFTLKKKNGKPYYSIKQYYFFLKKNLEKTTIDYFIEKIKHSTRQHKTTLLRLQ
jgi:hypothetical protein